MRTGLTVGRYVVLERVGEGGMGVVYAAFDPQLDRKIALKVLRGDRGAPEELAERRATLLKEAQVLGRLSHPNVVRALDVGTFDQQVFIAMEFMAGGTLRTWLQAEPRSRKDVLARFREAGAGLAAAHRAGVVHRDFKPDNVLLDEQGVAHVTDFGLASAAGEGRGRAGTTGYMAPEAAREVTPKVDQYAFCVSLWEALTGALPGAGELVAVPSWLKRVLLRGLNEDPLARFDSMDSLLTALAADPAQAWRTRLLVTGAVLLVVASVSVVVATLTRETPKERAQRLCVSRIDELHAALWSKGRQDAVRLAFSKVPGTGAQTLDLVRGSLDSAVETWAALAKQVCSLDEQDPSRARRARCLEGRQATLDGLLSLFAEADAQVVENAVATVSLEVPPVAQCWAEAPVHPEPEDRATANRLRADLARVRVQRTAGRLTEAVDTAERVVGEAKLQDDLELEAEATLLVGQMRAQRHDPDAEGTLHDAVLLADQTGSDEARAQAWTALVGWYSSDRGAEASFANRQAEAVLVRLGSPALLEAQRETKLGEFELTQNRNSSARQAFERALKLRREVLPLEHPLVINARSNLALTLGPDAREVELEQVLAARQQTLGSMHPETAKAELNLGLTLLELDRCETAAEHLERSVAIRLADGLDGPLRLGRTRGALARALACMNRRDEARQQQALAVEGLEAGRASDDELTREANYLRELRGDAGDATR